MFVLILFALFLKKIEVIALSEAAEIRKSPCQKTESNSMFWLLALEMLFNAVLLLSWNTILEIHAFCKLKYNVIRI